MPACPTGNNMQHYNKSKTKNNKGSNNNNSNNNNGGVSFISGRIFGQKLENLDFVWFS